MHMRKTGRREVYRELDEAYEDYLKAGGGEASRALAEELLPAVSWPEEWLRRQAREKRKARPPSSRAR
jgi:hypothetical protein